MKRNKIPLSNKAKYWIFRFYIWITLVLFVAAIVSVTTFTWGRDAAIRLTILGIPFVFIFSVQKFKLEEAALLEKLFAQFSARYATLKQEIRRIGTEESKVLNPDDWSFLESYFNLCAEEYVFFTSGHIPIEVWRSWENGMAFYFRQPRIKAAWDKDAADDSFFGFQPPL